MTRNILRVNIVSIQVNSNGDPPHNKKAMKKIKEKKGGKKKKDEKKNNAIIANLKYPRSGAPNVSSKIPVDLKDGVETTFDTKDFWDSGLFKEEIQGETILTIQVTDYDEISKLDKFLAKFFGTILGASLDLLTGGITNTIVGAVANLPTKAIKGSFKINKKESVDVIGEANIKLFESKIPKNLLLLDLKAPKTIEKPYYDWEKPGSMKVVQKRKVLIKEGQINGKIFLKLSLENR